MLYGKIFNLLKNLFSLISDAAKWIRLTIRIKLKQIVLGHCTF